MRQANNNTKATDHFTSPLLYQSFLEDDRLSLYIKAVAKSIVVLRAPLPYAIHNSTQLAQLGSITSSITISFSRSSIRVFLLFTIASNPKLLQFFVKFKIRQIPNPVV